MSDGILYNHRFLDKKAFMLHTKKNAGVKRKIQQNSSRINVKMKRKEQPDDPVWTDDLIRSLKSASDQREQVPQTSSGCVSGPECSWEVDSGFSSETSSSASGRSSLCASPSPSAVVALDCEMVGTGPSGCCSELARCSVVDYHGNILYDKYVQPCQPVTDYRTPWSGIQRHHLLKATPFAQAREEVGRTLTLPNKESVFVSALLMRTSFLCSHLQILATLDDKVVIGHAVYNDFAVLDIAHPVHMVRDTSSSALLKRLAGLSRRSSLKVLSRKLLNRKIQVSLTAAVFLLAVFSWTSSSPGGWMVRLRFIL